MQAGWQKSHQGYELRWKMGFHCDPHIVKKEHQFQEQSLSEEYMFCRHLTEVYSELPRPSHFRCRIRWPAREWMLQKENQICTVQYHLQTCEERQSGDWLHQKEAEYTKRKELVPGQSPGDPTSQKRRGGFYFIYNYCLCPTLQVRIEERQNKIADTESVFEASQKNGTHTHTRTRTHIYACARTHTRIHSPPPHTHTRTSKLSLPWSQAFSVGYSQLMQSRRHQMEQKLSVTNAIPRVTEQLKSLFLDVHLWGYEHLWGPAYITGGLQLKCQ